MPHFLLTTTFPDGVLESKDFLKIAGAARPAYRSAAPSFHIVSSYKVGANKTIDIVEATSAAEAKKGADAIAKATKTSCEVVEARSYNNHLASLGS